jgi:hypothetical protein
MIDEERTPLKTTRVARGHLQIEPVAPLAPGEYGLVLRPTKAHKSKEERIPVPSPTGSVLLGLGFLASRHEVTGAGRRPFSQQFSRKVSYNAHACPRGSRKSQLNSFVMET